MPSTTSVPTFESLRIWHDARRLTSRIYQVTGSQPFCTDFALRDQLRRASLSVMSNIAEGFERGGRKEFRHFLMIAKGSAGEVRSHLFAAEDVGLLESRVALQLREEVRALSRRIAALAATIRV